MSCTGRPCFKLINIVIYKVTLCTKDNNGHFQKEVGLFAKCDAVMQQHIARLQSTDGYHPHYTRENNT